MVLDQWSRLVSTVFIRVLSTAFDLRDLRQNRSGDVSEITHRFGIEPCSLVFLFHPFRRAAAGLGGAAKGGAVAAALADVPYFVRRVFAAADHLDVAVEPWQRCFMPGMTCLMWLPSMVTVSMAMDLHLAQTIAMVSPGFRASASAWVVMPRIWAIRSAPFNSGPA